MTVGDIELTSAVNGLKEHQRQLDPDGWEVGVSRQALDIVLEALARSGLEARKAEESMRSMGWFVRHDPGCEWQYFPGDPERSLAVRNWERKRAFIDEPAIRALPLTEGGDKP